MAQTQSSNRSPGGVDHLLLPWRRQPRGRDEQRLLEIGTIHGVGFVEDRQDVQFSFVEQPLDRHLGPGHEPLDKKRTVFPSSAGAVGARFRVLQEGVNPSGSGAQGIGIVGSDDPPARCAVDRFDDARQTDRACHLVGHPLRIAGHLDEGRLGDARPGQRCPKQALVTGGLHRLDGVVSHAQGRRDVRRGEHGALVDTKNGIQRPATSQRGRSLGALLRPAQVDRQVTTLHEGRQGGGLVRGDDHVDSEPISGSEERRGAIGPGRKHEHHAPTAVHHFSA